MLTSIRVWNFQSLEDIEVPLGPFTVIVGSSNSGKSALIRAATAVGRNSVSLATGLRRGKKSFTVNLSIDDAVHVVLARGERLSEYRILDTHSPANAVEEVYGKSGTSVPAEVAMQLAFAEVEGADLTFTTQHDGPFLMSAPGSTVARVLGSLTAATMLHDAVKEANRRKLAHGRQADTRRTDAASGTAKAKTYTNLKGRKAALDDAAVALDSVADRAAWVERLQGLGDALGAAKTALAAPLPGEVDTEPLETMIEEARQRRNRLANLRGWVDMSRIDRSDLEDLEALEVRLSEAEHQALEDYHRVLHDAGTCPTCGQSTADL